MRIIIGITGASGVIYGIQLLLELKKREVETHIVITTTAEEVIDHETKYTAKEIKEISDYYYDPSNLNAIINSGSFYYDAMIIIPCSMKTLSAIAHSYGDNTITRAADVTLKEKRKLIIVPRETPLRTKHLKNMTEISQEGGLILPAMPGFYHNPQTIEDQINFIIGKILDQLNIEHSLFNKWKQ